MSIEALDGKTFARFFECEGKEILAHITLPENISTVYALDLEGNRLNWEIIYNREELTASVPFNKF